MNAAFLPPACAAAKKAGSSCGNSHVRGRKSSSCEAAGPVLLPAPAGVGGAVGGVCVAALCWVFAAASERAERVRAMARLRASSSIPKKWLIRYDKSGGQKGSRALGPVFRSVICAVDPGGLKLRLLHVLLRHLLL